MKKNTQPQKTVIADFVKSIEDELNARELSLDIREQELDAVRDSIGKQKEDLDMALAAFSQEKAEFEATSQEVNAKFAKIRQDVELSEALKAQAHERKQLDALAKKAEEDRKLSEINLAEIQKREIALSVREKNYKEEIKKEFASNLFKA